jgi:Zn ribbon nucleic-acid-binding protein
MIKDVMKCPFCEYPTIAKLNDGNIRECINCKAFFSKKIEIEALHILEDCEDLKNCPVCHGHAKLGYHKKSNNEYTYWIQCIECGSSTRNFPSKISAQISWNTRKIQNLEKR